jgi:hypothetical protein
MSDSTQPVGEDSTNGSASDNAGRRRPTLAPMSSSVTAAPMKTRPPMTPLPPLAPRPAPPPEPAAQPVKKKSRTGLMLLVVLAAAGGAAYFLFLR